MATVVLPSKANVAESWKGCGPVLQLISRSPNISSSSDSEDQVGFNRGFPILAVTRRKQDGKSAKMKLRSPSLSSECSDSFEGNKSGSTSSRGSGRKVAGSNENTIRYSVQNLNKQMMDVNRRLSPDLRVSSASSLASDTAACLKLPKPMSRTTDVRNFLNQNGFLRTSTLTPGELELKRFKDTHLKDNSQHRKKKFKLNVNQLPRSTTPINDHDPDKLNMKQVIAFLQDQANRPSADHIHFNSTSEKKVLIKPTNRDFVEKQSLKQQRCFSEPPSSFPSTRDIACHSVTSTRSIPGNLKRVQSSARCGGARNSGDNSHVRPYSDIPGRDHRYRTFLSLEPNGFGLTTTPQYRIVEKFSENKNHDHELPVNYRSARFRVVKQNCDSKSDEKCSSGLDHSASFTIRSARVSKNAGDKTDINVKTEQNDIVKQSEQLVVNNQPSDSGISDVSQSETKNEESSKSSDSDAIRVPALDDFNDEWESSSDNDEDATNVSKPEINHSKHFDIRMEDNSEDTKSALCSNRFNNVPVTPKEPSHLSNVFRYIPNHRQHRRMKKINVELPHANGPEIPKSDVIKLTMRQGSHVTRHTSYMSDIATVEESHQSEPTTHLPIISIQDVHGAMVASTLQPIRERTAIQPATLSMTFKKESNKDNRSVNTAVDFDRIRKKKKSYSFME